jgi:hypothetical protein
MNIGISIVLLCLIGAAYDAAAQTPQVTNEINKSITLAAGANVIVHKLNGSVHVESWDAEHAEVSVRVEASDRDATTLRRIAILDAPNSLEIRGEGSEVPLRGNRWVNHNIFLRLPRAVGLTVRHITGSVDSKRFAGLIDVSHITGSVSAEQVGAATKIEHVVGSVSVSLAKLTDSGLRVAHVNGQIVIGLPAAINADLDISNINGPISCDLKMDVIGEMKPENLRAKLGVGGPPINITGILGSVKLNKR